MDTTPQATAASAAPSRVWRRSLSALLGIAAAIAIAISSGAGYEENSPGISDPPAVEVESAATEPIEVAALQSRRPHAPKRFVVYGVNRNLAAVYDAEMRAELQASVRDSMRIAREQLALERFSLTP